jgi:hypothetical protein
MAYMTLRLVVDFILLSRSMGNEQRINYSVIFQKHLNIDFATDYWNHVYEIPMHLYLAMVITIISTILRLDQCFCSVEGGFKSFRHIVFMLP